MDFATQRKYYNLCRVPESLAPDDQRNLDIDAFGKVRVRGISWVERLQNAIELADHPQCLLLTGLPGSGKSTELKRLAARLQHSTSGERYFPVLVDAEELLDLNNPIDIPDIIAALVFKLEEAVLTRHGWQPEQIAKEGYLSRLWTWLSKTDAELSKAEFGIPGGTKLVYEMRTRPTLREKVRNTIATHLSRFLQEAQDEIQRLQTTANAGQVVLIFDSLEKLRGTSGNWDAVLASVERLFSSGAPHLHLPVHVLYTVPPALVNRLAERIHFLPMIKLADRNGQPYPPGLAAARELVRRRLPDAVLQDVFGPDSEARVEKLIQWSGGYPREIVRLLREALAASAHPLNTADFERIINELKDAYRKIVPAEAFAWLAKVATEKYLTIEDDKHRTVADQMLSNNAVLRYLNHNDWFDLHPAVAAIPGVQETLAELAKPTKPADGT